ncbi:MAG: sulfate adenylyltransferase [bacterium]|nr:sulfate adenylyltransferase [bacterium]
MQLVENILQGDAKIKAILLAKGLPFLVLDEEQIKDVKNIARGVYSPLTGFLKKADFEAVVKTMRLISGEVWPIPIVLDVSENMAQSLEGKNEVALKDEKGEVVALLKGIEIFDYSKEDFCQNVFGTIDQNHPGVNEVFKMKNKLIGGEVWLINDEREPFPEYNLTPKELREAFQEKGWQTIVAFQTRNVPHRGHEYLQKEALKLVDGLLIQPVIGRKKQADFKDEYIIASYEVLLDRYYEKNKALLSVLPLKMRYAGPREAVLHALIRRNFGCTHFIVGRDHAGVGNYYGPYDAQNIFEKFKKDEIGIEILKFPEVVYLPQKNDYAFKTNKLKEEAISFSGTKLRGYLENKEKPPRWLLRPEVYFFLSQSQNSLVDEMYQNKNKQKGFVLWFTGLSQSGKSSNADVVYGLLKEKGVKVERLDGDVVREYLSSDLGFTKEDRDENIRRIGFVSKLLSKNGIAVLTSFISPYNKEREMVRAQIENFIEVFCNCSLEHCEQRDTRGLYKKARSGEVKHFTGISDPYEAPLNPEITIDTFNQTKEQNAQQVMTYLIGHNLI